VELHRSTFPDLRITVTDVLAEGDRVAVQWTAQGTHHGPYGSVPPTGAGIIVRGMDLVHIAGGRIVTLHSFFDLLAVVRQLRAHPVWRSTSAPGMLGPRSPRQSRRE
jgi:predicted ester cyclase